VICNRKRHTHSIRNRPQRGGAGRLGSAG